MTSDGLRNFIANGGRLRFKPFVGDDDKLFWEMHGIGPDGEEQPVYEGRTGEVRVVKSTRGIVGYWRIYHPEDLEVPVPVLPDGAGKL
ncbi:hypothetical protein [Amaricoccus solimangrovi]|uniref:Uncharacterized protein n=1 Tax=Amaricoccus solimangrovi TaxID=2589815 RepID=A0A501WG33_9RHOB|nr:hypothetical protein [Amaricoccus solimangrovi]TPE47320.1 hypothetical protein FJM51_20285 [Amaricoccus solimangrovi]